MVGREGERGEATMTGSEGVGRAILICRYPYASYYTSVSRRLDLNIILRTIAKLSAIITGTVNGFS